MNNGKHWYKIIVAAVTVGSALARADAWLWADSGISSGVGSTTTSTAIAPLSGNNIGMCAGAGGSVPSSSSVLGVALPRADTGTNFGTSTGVSTQTPSSVGGPDAATGFGLRLESGVAPSPGESLATQHPLETGTESTKVFNSSPTASSQHDLFGDTIDSSRNSATGGVLLPGGVPPLSPQGGSPSSSMGTGTRGGTQADQ